MLRFIHAADIHLDSPLHGLERYEGAPVEAVRMASRRALQNLVHLAIVQRVHFVVLSGDVFDGDWPDVSTGLFFVQQMARLQQQGIQVFLISGNHDAANRMTRRLPYPANVQSFPQERSTTIVLDQFQVAIHGHSYPSQKETRNLAAAYPTARPGYINIGLLHTGLDGREGHERYAPCRLEELVARGYDYWALGHIHQRESVNGKRVPHVEFPGNLQGRHCRETGAKGCLLVHVDSSRKMTTEFCPLDVMRWACLKVDCTGTLARDELLEQIEGTMDEHLEQADGRPLAARLELTGTSELHDELLSDPIRLRDEIRAAALTRGPNRLWIEKIQVNTKRPGDENAAIEPSDDAHAEVAGVIQTLRTEPARLLACLNADELKQLQGRLPPELREGELAICLNDPYWAASLLDRVQALLVQSTRVVDGS